MVFRAEETKVPIQRSGRLRPNKSVALTLLINFTVIGRRISLAVPRFRIWWREFNQTDYDEIVEAECLSDDEAIATLRRVGNALALATISDYGEVEAPYDATCLGHDIIHLCKKLQPHEFNENVPRMLWRFMKNIASRIPFIVPGFNVHLIREVELAEDIPPLVHRRDATPIEIGEFGRAVSRDAEVIVRDPGAASDVLRSLFDAPIVGLEHSESCVDLPSSPSEGVVRLQTILANRTTPRQDIHRLETYAVITTFIMLILFTVPWAQLGDKAALNGVTTFVPSLLGLALASAGFCSLIAEKLMTRLSRYTIVSCKTFARVNTIILALASLELGLGLADENVNRLAVAVGVVLYVCILLATVAGDNLVGNGEARFAYLDKLTLSNSA